MPIRRVDILDAPSGEKVTVGSGSNTFTLPTTRGTDAYVLTRDNSIGTGGTTWKETVIPPTITSVTYPTQNGVQATALAATGAQDTTAETLLINGENLGTASIVPTVQIEVSGSYVAFAGTISCNAAGTVVTCTNVTKRAAADNYNIKLTHSGNSQTVTTTVNFNADPSFSTASGSLGTVYTGSAMSTKTITAGSSVSWYEGTPAMPTWMTHFTDGATGTSQNLTGTPTNSGSTEVQTFNIIIRDSENQSHNRDFSLTVVDIPYGGTIIEPASYTGGGYRSHTFFYAGNSTSTNTFSLYTTTTIDVLLVGGGGGTYPADRSGGGGAGAFVPLSSQSWPAGDYTMTVGVGGSNSTTNANNMGGETSITYSGSGSFTALYAKGGGAGIHSGTANSSLDESSPTKYGGSGGGAGYTGSPGTGGSYGNNGSNHSGGTGNNIEGGGGGGAGGNAVDATSSAGGTGGAGSTNYWRDGNTSGTTAGTHVFAGGGGGGAYNDAGGTGGKVGTTVLGGNGGRSGVASVQGVDGTGSGGGGGGQSSLIPSRGGGHGVIILRYAW